MQRFLIEKRKLNRLRKKKKCYKMQDLSGHNKESKKILLVKILVKKIPSVAARYNEKKMFLKNYTIWTQFDNRFQY